MQITVTARLVLSCLAPLLVALAISGCSGGEDEQDYGEVLQGLQRAALAGEEYDGADRVAGLEPAQRDVVLSFCEFAWQIGANSEAWKLSTRGYAWRRVKRRAYARANARLTPIEAATARLDDVIDLESLDGRAVRRYNRACG